MRLHSWPTEQETIAIMDRHNNIIIKVQWVYSWLSEPGVFPDVSPCPRCGEWDSLGTRWVTFETVYFMPRQPSVLGWCFFYNNHLDLLQATGNADDHMKTPSMQSWVICKVIRSTAWIENLIDQSAYTGRLVSIVSADHGTLLPNTPPHPPPPKKWGDWDDLDCCFVKTRIEYHLSHPLWKLGLNLQDWWNAPKIPVEHYPLSAQPHRNWETYNRPKTIHIRREISVYLQQEYCIFWIISNT